MTDTAAPTAYGIRPNHAAAAAPVVSAELLIAGTALLLLLVAQWSLSQTILATNYYGGDGKMAQAVALMTFKFGGYFDITNLSPIQGFGSQALPKNVWVNPAFWPFALFAKETATDVSAVIALACFAGAAYVMMRCFDAPVLVSALAAQACIALFAPALLLTHTPTNFCLTPGDAVVYAPYMVALGLLARIEPGSWRTVAATGAGILILILYSIYCDPVFTMLAAIGWSVPFAVVALGTLRLRTIMVRCAALAGCLGVFLLSGVATYLYTLSQYTARVQYAETVDRVRGPQLVSAMTYSANMKYFYVACAIGWLAGLVALRGRGRLLVVAASTSFAVWLLYSLVYLLLNAAWVPPIPLYLEHCLFALYLAAAVLGYWGLFRAAVVLARRALAPLVGNGYAILRRPAPAPLSAQAAGAAWDASPWQRRLAVATSVLCVALLPAKVVHYALTDGRAYATTFYLPWTDEPELLSYFRDRIGLEPGGPFRGAVHFLLGVGGGRPTGETSGALAIRATQENLWSHAVATISDYNQLTPPEPFYFVGTLFKRDMRALLNTLDFFWGSGAYTPAYWTTLQLLGARYHASKWPLPAEVDPGLPLIAMPPRPERADEPQGTWYVYELPRPNIGDYSPTEIITAGTGPEIMAILSRPGFDYTRQVVLAPGLDGALVPARDMRFSIIRGGSHVSGKSSGTSLVVLPQLFSHCLRARDPRVRFVRADLMMAGVIFTGDIDTDILFDYGLFSPGCRRADLADLRQLNLKIDQRMPHLEGDGLFPEWDHAIATLSRAVAAIR